MATHPRELAEDQQGHGCFAVDLDGQVHGYVPSVRDMLITRGALTKDAHGVWHLAWHGFDLEQELGLEMACCDFCSQRPVAWIVPCASFWMPAMGDEPPVKSLGDWAACETCGGLIAGREKRALLERCVPPSEEIAQMMRANGQEVTPAFLAFSRQFKTRLHARFWASYTGGAWRATR